MSKATYRIFFAKQRKALSLKDRASFSEIALSNLIHTKYYQEASVIFTFISYKDEIDTLPLIKKALLDKKTVCVPKVEPEHKLMKAYDIRNLDEVKPGYRGILEPISIENRLVPRDLMDLVIVPGLAYDLSGFRLGYGGGYYDKFLSGKSDCPTLLGYGFDFQITDVLPFEEHDIPVDGIVTEKRFLSLKRAQNR